VILPPTTPSSAAPVSVLVQFHPTKDHDTAGRLRRSVSKWPSPPIRPVTETLFRI
jgi:hypothetical protein